MPAETAVGREHQDLGTRAAAGPDARWRRGLVPVSARSLGPKIVSECQFFGIADQKSSVFSFGAKQVGRAYTIAVKRQPYGKVCQFEGGGSSKTVSLATSNPEIIINCADDPAVQHYTVTVNVAPAAASKPGLQVVLTTESGTCPVDVDARSVVTFSTTECPTADHRHHRMPTTYQTVTPTNQTLP